MSLTLPGFGRCKTEEARDGDMSAPEDDAELPEGRKSRPPVPHPHAEGGREHQEGRAVVCGGSGVPGLQPSCLTAASTMSGPTVSGRFLVARLSRLSSLALGSGCLLQRRVPVRLSGADLRGTALNIRRDVPEATSSQHSCL